MKPVNYTETHDKIIFNYSYPELKKFIERGKSHGDVGIILLEYDNGTKKYKGFGTIENPCKEMIAWTLKHFPQYDGGEFDPDKILNPSKPIIKPESMRLVWLNLGK